MNYFRTNEPIYLQLINLIKLDIIKGIYPEGSQCPSVRDLAEKYGINPGTVQKSLTLLEEEGLLKAENTSGHFIVLGEENRQKILQETAIRLTKEYLDKMQELGYNDQDIRNQIKTNQKKVSKKNG